MNIKISSLSFALILISLILSGCANKQSATDNFTAFDPTNCVYYDSINYDEYFSAHASSYSFKHPPEWDCGWFADSGIRGLLLSSCDPDAAFQLKCTSGIVMDFFLGVNSDDDEEITDFFSSEEATLVTINGQDAARIEYTRGERMNIQIIIVREKIALGVLSKYPIEKDTEFRPLVEAIINTIEIK
jgi:hypothetical protein